MESETTSQKGFAQRQLPWLIATGVLLLYLLTLDRWVNYRSLAALIKAVGWDWRPSYVAPLHFLLTYPIRWLPSGWQIVGLNFFSALCAFFTLALLARSVAILPHDRTRDQRQAERSDYSFLTIRAAWLPPLLATLVCGLQLSFWENAIISTGETLDVLLFAYVVRCLLEFRLDERESWLTRLTLVYGLGITNNFAMIAFLPALLVALIWTKGIGFFNVRFCLRLFLFGLAGLSLYLLLPAIASFSDSTGQTFWQALKLNLGFQKASILKFPRYIILILSMTSLAPVLFMGIKWPASFGDVSASGNALTNVMTHVIHGVFLLACLYVSFDPPFSPRQLGTGFAFLPFYYLGALAIGYCSGYFLLVFSTVTPGRTWQRPSLFQRLINYVLVAVIWISLVCVPVGLIYKNLPQIQISRGRDLGKFGELAAQSLPPQGGVVLSDDPYRLYALQSVLEQRREARHKYLLVDTTSLRQPAYHRFLGKKSRQLWPNLPYENAAGEGIDDATLVQLLADLSRSSEIYYLHPSFGYYFEKFYLIPHNLVYLVKPYPTNSVTGPMLSAAEATANDEFWRKAKATDLSGLIQAIKQRKPEEKPNPYLAYTGVIYSRALDFFGVELQKSGQLEKAAEYFAYALELNPDNPAAFINQDYNRILRAGKRENPKPSDGALKRLAPYSGNWNALLGDNGPLDEPSSCLLLARVFTRGQNHYQAAQQLLRVLFYDPQNLEAKIALANVYLQGQLPDKTLEVVADIRALTAQLDPQRFDPADQVALTQTEALAYARRKDLTTAVRILTAAQQKFPQFGGPYATLSEIYYGNNQITNALAVLEKQLKIQPENINGMINYSRLKILNGEFQEAVHTLDRALNLYPDNPYALMNRAIANLQDGKLDAAQSDYETLERILPKPLHTVYYGLGEVFYQKKNSKMALQYYNQYLKLAPRGTPEVKFVQERISKLKNGSI